MVKGFCAKAVSVKYVLMVSEIVVGVLSSWIPLTVVSVQGMRHSFKELPLVLPVSSCIYTYSQLPVETAAMAGFSETSSPQLQKVFSLCD